MASMNPATISGLPTPPLDGNISYNVRTSGQHQPLYEDLRLYQEFPDEITGPTLWKPEQYKDNAGGWTHRFTDDELEELSQAADAFRAAELPLTDIAKVDRIMRFKVGAGLTVHQDNFQLPQLSKLLETKRCNLVDGTGFTLFKGFPVEEWGIQKSAIAYMGMGAHFGYLVSQNGKGHVLGHVKDLGEDIKQNDKVRVYRTNARQYFHTDDSDIVGLLCIARALEGGESDIVSSHHVYNTLKRERPDVLKTLTEPIWYVDRKGEVSQGQEPYIRTSVVYLEPKGQGRIYWKWDPYYIRSLDRFSSKGIIPPLSEAQVEAAEVLEATCKRLALHMILEVGDIQFLSNTHVLHARTEYRDQEPPAPRRHLMRLWLATPEDEGGWKLPFHDSKAKKRGGIQVDDTAPVANLEAE